MVGRDPCCGRLAPPVPVERITFLRGRVHRLLGPSVPVMIFTALWSWFWVWLCWTHPCGRVGPLLWSAGPSHSVRTDNRTMGVCVQRLLVPSVPVMIFTALWSWFWVWLCRTHPCGRAGPFLWSAGPSCSCRTDNLFKGTCTPSARSQRPCNDIHGPVVVVLGVAVWDTPLWSSWTLVVVGWPLPFL